MKLSNSVKVTLSARLQFLNAQLIFVAVFRPISGKFYTMFAMIIRIVIMLLRWQRPPNRAPTCFKQSIMHVDLNNIIVQG